MIKINWWKNVSPSYRKKFIILTQFHNMKFINGKNYFFITRKRLKVEPLFFRNPHAISWRWEFRNEIVTARSWGLYNLMCHWRISKCLVKFHEIINEFLGKSCPQWHFVSFGIMTVNDIFYDLMIFWLFFIKMSSNKCGDDLIALFYWYLNILHVHQSKFTSWKT